MGAVFWSKGGTSYVSYSEVTFLPWTDIWILKVLLAHSFYSEPGGECHAVRAQRALLEGKGHQVVPFFRENSSLFGLGPLGKVSAALRTRENRPAMRELQALVREEMPDIAHVHNVYPTISPEIYPTLQKLGVPVVQSVHNLRLRCPVGLMFRNGRGCEECVSHGMYRAVVNKCVQNSAAASALYADATWRALRKGYFQKQVNRFIVFNQYFMRQLEAAGIAREKMTILPNAVDIQEGPLQAKLPYAVFLGRLSSEKGISVILDAWSRVRGVTLKIAGEGEWRAEIERRATGDLAGKIEYLGFISGGQKTELLRKASVCLLPSLCHENCPISLLESLAAGTAVIATRMGGLPDMVIEGGSGVLIPPGDPVALAAAVNRFTETEVAGSMGRTAFEDAKRRFDAKSYYPRLLAVYDDVIAEHKRAQSSNTTAGSTRAG